MKQDGKTKMGRGAQKEIFDGVDLNTLIGLYINYSGLHLLYDYVLLSRLMRKI